MPRRGRFRPSCAHVQLEARLRLPGSRGGGSGRERQRGLLLIANYLSRQLRTIIRHAVRGSGCAAFRDIARRIRTNFSLGCTCTRTCVYMRVCCVCCAARGERRGEGRERNRCTRQRDADRRCSFSFFLASPSSFAFRSASPILPLPPFPLHSPSAQSVPPRRLFISPSPPVSPLPFSSRLSRDRALASRDHSLRGCAAARYHGSICSRPLSRRRSVANVTVDRESSIIERSVGVTERLRGEGKEGFDNIYIYIFVETKNRSIISFASLSFIVISAMTSRCFPRKICGFIVYYVIQLMLSVSRFLSRTERRFSTRVSIIFVILHDDDSLERVTYIAKHRSFFLSFAKFFLLRDNFASTFFAADPRFIDPLD